MSIRLFIADTDESHVKRVSSLAARCPDLKVVGAGANGAQVLKQLAAAPADMLITEIQLPGMDGLTLLKRLRDQPSRPAAIVCTAFYSPACVTRARSYGAEYCLYKPLDYESLPETIRACHQLRLKGASDARKSGPVAQRQRRASAIRSLLTESGMPAKLNGSLYLTEALLIAGEEPGLLKNLSKGLYARVAERTGATPSQLERAVRNAVAIACERGGLAQRFGHKPTNREIIAYLLEQVEMRVEGDN